MSQAKRKTISKTKPALMGLSEKDKYPLTNDGKTPSKERADAAVKRAGQQYAKGNLTSAERKTIDRKAYKILGTEAKKRAMTRRRKNNGNK